MDIKISDKKNQPHSYRFIYTSNNVANNVANIVTNIVAIIFITLILTNCSSDNSPGVPAPIGDKSVLEKLAVAYTNNVEKQQVAPASMRPNGKLVFIKQVFTDAGYDYSLTLLMLSGSQFDPGIKLHYDLAELVLSPQTGLSYEDYATIFSEEEVKAIKVIQNTLRKK